MRPSGTEDILRLYVEAFTDKDLDELANKILLEIDKRYRVPWEDDPDI